MINQILNNPMILPVWISMICGVIIGIERELKQKDAGIKTSIFICLGSTLFTFLGTTLDGTFDSSRVIAQIVSGIGFIGGGVIFVDNDRVQGMTSAAIIWLCASIGIMCGLKMYLEAILCSITIIIVEYLFGKIKDYLNKDKENESL